jgi:hypothetical protein
MRLGHNFFDSPQIDFNITPGKFFFSRCKWPGFLHKGLPSPCQFCREPPNRAEEVVGVFIMRFLAAVRGCPAAMIF